MNARAISLLQSIQSTDVETLPSHNFVSDEMDWECPSTTIVRAYSQKHKAPWGLVLIRSTYTSPSKWDSFLKTAKDRTRRYLESENALDLWKSLSWTILEEKEGTDIVHCSEKFRNWIQTEVIKEPLSPCAHARKQWPFAVVWFSLRVFHPCG